MGLYLTISFSVETELFFQNAQNKSSTHTSTAPLQRKMMLRLRTSHAVPSLAS